MPNGLSSIRNIIFDWSGVISDDFEKIYLTYCELFKLHNIETHTREYFKDNFELPYINFCARYFPGVPNSRLQDDFRRCFKRLSFNTLPFDFVQEVLEELQRRGLRMVVLSSHSFVSRELTQYYPGKSYFTRIYEDVPNKEDIIESVVAEMNFDADETVFVGDMTHDILTGKKARLKTIAVCSGYQSAAVLERVGPDLIVPDIRSLLKLVCDGGQ